jgi:DNA-binding CsgD family transcriptional regulator
LGKALLALRKRNYHKLSDPQIVNALAPLIESFGRPRTEVIPQPRGVLEEAIAQLPHRERRLVAILYYLDASPRWEVGGRVGLSERTLYRHLRLIREELAILLWRRIHQSVTDTNGGEARETALADPIQALEFLLREEFGLSTREVEVALLLAEPPTKWLRNCELAEKMHISENTLKTHLRHIYRKLGVRSRAEVAAKIAELTNSKMKRKSENETGKGYPEVAPRTSKDSRGLSSYPAVHRYLGSG